MDTRTIELSGGRKVAVAEAGKGRPLLYLHGFADVHGASVGWLPIHEKLAQSFRVIAPAHPAAAGSDEDEEIEDIDDVAFHYLEVLDALGLAKVDVVGYCFGGWIAAELAARHRERVNRLVLIGASGLFMPNQPIGDLFWEVQAQNGVEYRGLRELLFANPGSAAATELLPDGRSVPEREVSRYKVMRFASRVGFKPPYFYHRRLRERLARFTNPALVIWGEQDRMVPIAHARAYRDALAGAKLHVFAGAGHCVHVEKPDAVAKRVQEFLAPVGAARKAAPKKVAGVAQKRVLAKKSAAAKTAKKTKKAKT